MTNMVRTNTFAHTWNLDRTFAAGTGTNPDVFGLSSSGLFHVQCHGCFCYGQQVATLRGENQLQHVVVHKHL